MLTLALAGLGGSLLGASVAGGAVYLRKEREAVDEEVDAVTTWGDDGHLIELEPIDVTSSSWGLVQTWRRRAKEKKLAKKGYVKWYRLDSRLEEPKWVKPATRGTGVPEYHGEDEGPYFFPKDAMVPDSQTGAWVALHEVGDADPVNLRETEFPGLPADRVEEILNLEAEATKPGFFENLDLSASQAFIIITVVLFLVYAATRVL